MALALHRSRVGDAGSHGAGNTDHLLRALADMAAFDAFYRRLIEAVPLKNVSSHFARERAKSTTAYPIETT